VAVRTTNGRYRSSTYTKKATAADGAPQAPLEARRTITSRITRPGWQPTRLPIKATADGNGQTAEEQARSGHRCMRSPVTDQASHRRAPEALQQAGIHTTQQKTKRTFMAAPLYSNEARCWPAQARGGVLLPLPWPMARSRRQPRNVTPICSKPRVLPRLVLQWGRKSTPYA